MLINRIVNLINKQLADELISQAELVNYMDRVIDDINTQLDACFPTFSDVIALNAADPDYTAFPDKYIRTVVIPGAALKFYTTDEEGGYSAPKYEEDYRQGLFYMTRDYMMQIPEEYRAENQGAVIFKKDFDEPLRLPRHIRGIF